MVRRYGPKRKKVIADIQKRLSKDKILEGLGQVNPNSETVQSRPRCPEPQPGTSSSVATTSHYVGLTNTGKPILNTRLSDLYSLTTSSQLGSDPTIYPKE